MRLLFVIIAVIAGYFAIQQYNIHQDKDSFKELVSSIEGQSINQFDLKKSLNTQIAARCQSIENLDSDLSRTDECIKLVEANQSNCDFTIFRLAPVEFTTRDEAFEYGTRYQKCVLGKEFAELVDENY